LPLWLQSASPTGAKEAEEYEQYWRSTQGGARFQRACPGLVCFALSALLPLRGLGCQAREWPPAGLWRRRGLKAQLEFGKIRHCAYGAPKPSQFFSVPAQNRPEPEGFSEPQNAKLQLRLRRTKAKPVFLRSGSKPTRAAKSQTPGTLIECFLEGDACLGLRTLSACLGIAANVIIDQPQNRLLLPFTEPATMGRKLRHYMPFPAATSRSWLSQRPHGTLATGKTTHL